EAGELVDHLLELVRVHDDGVGALLEEGPVTPPVVAKAALQALGRELDGSQGVLDLVRDAPGDLAPGHLALSLDEMGHVVDDDDYSPGSRLAWIRHRSGDGGLRPSRVSRPESPLREARSLGRPRQEGLVDHLDQGRGVSLQDLAELPSQSLLRTDR